MLQGEPIHMRRKAALALTLQPSVLIAAPASPCNESCRHFARCAAQGLACAALDLFETTGRFSQFAPRQPTAAIYERIHAPGPPRSSVDERRRAREALAITLAREAAE
jgi:hypothetical protein